MDKQAKCPNCGKLTSISPNNPHRPFCSERCRVIDLGDWLNERYKIESSENEIWGEEDKLYPSQIK